MSVTKILDLTMRPVLEPMTEKLIVVPVLLDGRGGAVDLTQPGATPWLIPIEEVGDVPVCNSLGELFSPPLYGIRVGEPQPYVDWREDIARCEAEIRRGQVGGA